MKKKLIASLLAATMLLTLSACGGKDSNTADSEPVSATDTEQAADIGTDSETVTDTQDAPDDAASENANKATQDGVYLYNGTFLATGEAVKISDSGTAIDMPSVTVNSAKAKLQSDGTYNISDEITFVMDGTSPITDGHLVMTNDAAPHEYGQCNSGNMISSIFYNDTDERVHEPAPGSCIWMQFAFHDNFPDNDTSRNKASLEINGNPAFSLDTGRTLESLIDIYGEPAGAYCKKDDNYDLPDRLYYIWKSGNYPDKTLIMAYEINYNWSGKSSGSPTVKERNGDDERYRLLNFFIAEDAKAYEAHTDRFATNSLLPTLAELGLYSN